MAKLVPVQYGGLHYPNDIKPIVGEIPLKFHYGETEIRSHLNEMMERGVKYFSIHTQQPFDSSKDVKSRIKKNQSSIVAKYDLSLIKETPVNLWSSEEWIDEFIKFFRHVSNGSFKDYRDKVKVVELHPPYKSIFDKPEAFITYAYSFIEKLEYFCDEVHEMFPGATFVVENINNQNDKMALVSDTGLITLFSQKIDEFNKNNNKFKFGIALDIPQLLGVRDLKSVNATKEGITNLFKELEGLRHNIVSVHLWGMDGDRPHKGGVRTLFDLGNESLSNDDKKRVENLKLVLLKSIESILSDEKERYFVPELIFGSKEQLNIDLKSIVNDIVGTGIQFENPRY